MFQDHVVINVVITAFMFLCFIISLYFFVDGLSRPSRDSVKKLLISLWFLIMFISLASINP
jgi:hypothetical protein